MSEADRKMSDRKADLAAVSTFADHEVIVPPNKLKKAVQKVLDTTVEFDPVAKAEAALAELSKDFSAWMGQEYDRLDAARHAMRAGGINQGTRDGLFLAAHDIKGQAATFGFPLVAPVADSLCRLIEHTPDMARLPFALIDQHVDAIRAITRKNTRGNSDANAARLSQKLRQVTDGFLSHENRDRPEYLESILSPAIAPG
jgi:HPt (histidine-containing phosphotransfer) domain-containing protein